MTRLSSPLARYRQWMKTRTSPSASILACSDIDALLSESARFTVSVASGKLTVTPAMPAELAVTGSGSSQVLIVGSLNAITTWKGGTNALVYRGNLDFNGTETLTVKLQ